MQNAFSNSIMATRNPYAPAVLSREHRVQVLRLRRHASRTEAVVRAAIMAAALTMLAVGLNSVLHTGSRQIASSLEAATGIQSVQ